MMKKSKIERARACKLASASERMSEWAADEENEDELIEQDDVDGGDDDEKKKKKNW
jgi:hypothetical protein